MFLNISNHPSERWSKEQKEAAGIYGEVVDLTFPSIRADDSTDSVAALADEYAAQVADQYMPQRDVVHVMGEMTFTYALVARLRRMGFTCLASTTSRIKQQMPDGSFISEFRFQTFRNYE